MEAIIGTLVLFVFEAVPFLVKCVVVKIKCFLKQTIQLIPVCAVFRKVFSIDLVGKAIFPCHFQQNRVLTETVSKVLSHTSLKTNQIYAKNPGSDNFR